MLPSKYRWIQKTTDEAKAEQLALSLHLSPLVARMLVQRGVDSLERAASYLNPEEQPLDPPELMKGITQAATRVRAALAAGEKICIFGDYDADGVTSTAMMARALRRAGADVVTYIPDRFKDGYGPNVAAVESAAERGVQLIITVDSGIAAPLPAARARELTIDYIVTDHHEVPLSLPEAAIIVNPKQPGCPYPFKALCGAGVVLKLLQAVFTADFDERLLDLAAIGTIADLVPLCDENRTIVARGLQQISSGSYAGVEALKRVAGTGDVISSEDVAFRLAPRLNAAGRLESADIALQLLLTDDTAEAEALASRLGMLNDRRKALVDNVVEDAVTLAEPYADRGDCGLVLAQKGWHAGVIGIAASKLVERYHRPVVLLSIDAAGGTAKGSARSIPAVNLYEAVSACAAHLLKFGGHPLAAGMTLESKAIDDFRTCFSQAVARSLGGPLPPAGKEVDAVLPVEALTARFIETLERMEPFGAGNPPPLFQISSATALRVRAVGSGRSHLKLTLAAGGAEADAIGFQLGAAAAALTPDDRVDCIGTCTVHEWNGVRKPQFLISDLRVEGVQVFDWRIAPAIHDKLANLDGGALCVAFHQQTLDRLSFSAPRELYRDGLSVEQPALVLLDLPESETKLARLVAASPSVHRFYLIFMHDDDRYLSTFPSRVLFAECYKIVRSCPSMAVQGLVEAMVKRKHWTKHMVEFMIQVFFELGFVRIDEGILTNVERPEKKKLESSSAYQHEKKQMDLEKKFCYSPAGTVRQWLLEHSGRKIEKSMTEGTVCGL
ncbi:MAG: single-stranded-DNA-specific exonuclease RecJ [Sporolactobacillus sp.]